MRIASPEFGPISLIAIRAWVAALVLLPLIFIRREWPLVFKLWHHLSFVGVITTAVPFILIAYATLYITAGGTSLLNATVPMFSAMVAWLWLRESLNLVGIAGLLLGFAGVAILTTPEGGDYRTVLLPSLAVLLATALYALGSCYTKLYLQSYPAPAVTAGCQFFAALFMLVPGVIMWPDAVPSFVSWVSALALGVFCTAMAWMIFFHLLKSAGVNNTVVVTYLIPVFSILWGGLFLDEIVTANMLLGGVLILCSVALTTSSYAKKRVVIVHS